MMRVTRDDIVRLSIAGPPGQSSPREGDHGPARSALTHLKETGGRIGFPDGDNNKTRQGASMTTQLGQRILRPLATLLAFIWLALAASPGTADASALAVRIDLSSQRMQVSITGRPTYSWAVSTARPGYRTPTGRFRPIRLERVWYSSIYDSAPMPNSIFFHGGYAIHGT